MKKEQLLKFLTENPTANQKTAASHFGVSRQRISQACKSLEISPPLKKDQPHKQYTGRTSNNDSLPDFFGNVHGSSRNKKFLGDVCEAIVCADLLASGYLVFTCATGVAPFDLIVVVEEKLYRVEVKCARMYDGVLTGGYPTNDCWDILARVTPDRKCHYQAFKGTDLPFHR